MAITARHTATLALAHALSAAERGLPVFPLSSTKLPALRSPHRGEPEPVLCRGECGRPGHGVHDATTDLTGVRTLFAAAPWATGYGIACGRPPHHLIGIDLDVTSEPAAEPAPDSAPDSTFDAPPDSVAALQQLALQHLFTLPETVVVLTPSGGRHIWLTGPPNVVVPNSAGRLAPGIDVRGAGGYLVGPGSVTARGAYRPAPGTAGLAPAPCPRALLRLLTPPAPPTRAPHHRHRSGAAQEQPARGHGLVQFVRAAHAGQRNTRLFWAACRAYEHGFGETLTEPLVDAAVHTGLTEQEARATIASAARLAAGP
ncbi:bifunctional DNA primase/polymerase [Streptomyces scopuliridis]|uniref:Bifunctional DNA primase/polymerase n=1 Tax=Streptomyces scopuliridis TaxID=452529 RepID=A0ACD4ZLB4_9ACTN|nr:bifunctional DNA primase/polymerase [Streptomyces scopuliridis]WSB99158.1 bifunctional DNA primase/polymerase [Streptomyces scopuliridis]WSC07140.1 bifunctional DNA primase/polymerase [Streptomyces scopuliridis]